MMSIIGPIAARSLSNMYAKSTHAHLLHSRHALRENGCHGGVVLTCYHWRISCERRKIGRSHLWVTRGVYGDACTGASNVRWVKHFKSGNTDIADQLCCGRLRTAATERNKQKVDELIRQDRRMSEKLQSSLAWGTIQSRRWWRFWDIG
jgi:hypothetical protein